ncbi:hypothetical protein SLEP1_g53677 [Rubroshorea leprosula]|uniref:Uncharacterized protein n=1 Tax=Rubroshorea leprosula TaxID=152421 RepID=A0AAV5MA95_9ROSI|nr:hypothetical protein SLEP1_g53677 [Rubroshorea leprosula]
MRSVALSNASSFCRITAMRKSNKSHSHLSNKDPEPNPPRIKSNVKQNLQFLRLWKEFQRSKSTSPKPATSYRRKKPQKEQLPQDIIDLRRDPTTTLY